MPTSTHSRPAGCLLVLVQTSAGMGEPLSSKPVLTKLQAAQLLVDKLVDYVFDTPHAEGIDLGQIELAIFGYSAEPGESPRFSPLLPGSSPERSFVPLVELDAPPGPRRENGPRRWVRAEPAGASVPREALEHGRVLLETWVREHPGATSPIVVHCCDEAATSEDVAHASRAMLDLDVGGSPLVIFHCLFKTAHKKLMCPSTAEPAWAAIWAASSPLTSSTTEICRALTINCLPAKPIYALAMGRWTARDPAPSSPVAEAREGHPESVEGGLFSARAYRVAKLGNLESDWEDAFAYDMKSGVATVCDGATQGIFTAKWAQILARSYTESPIDLDDEATVAGWLAERRSDWLSTIDRDNLHWAKFEKLRQYGASATLLALVVDPGAESWRAWAVGDACLFHVRGDQVLSSFPMADSKEFGRTPPLLRTMPGAMIPRPVGLKGDCLPGDLLLLATDALAQWFLLAIEEGMPPDWGSYESLGTDAWVREIGTLRAARRIVNDDCTLLVLRVAEQARAAENPLVD